MDLRPTRSPLLILADATVDRPRIIAAAADAEADADASAEANTHANADADAAAAATVCGGSRGLASGAWLGDTEHSCCC